jgi:hypothetical protein
VKLAADFSESAGKPGKPIIGMGSEGAAMGLQLFVRRTADVVIIDLHGKATIGAANDILRNQLRRLIEDGISKVLVNLTDLTQLDSSSIRYNRERIYVSQAPRREPETAATSRKCEVGSGDGALTEPDSQH